MFLFIVVYDVILTYSLYHIFIISLYLMLLERSPSRVLFSVKRNNDYSASDDQYWTPIDCDSEHANEPAGVFDLNSDRFTAPVSGFYYFQVDCSSSSSRNLHLALYVNEQQSPRHAHQWIQYKRRWNQLHPVSTSRPAGICSSVAVKSKWNLW